MTRVRFLREAREELRAAAHHYEGQRPGLGTAFALEVRRAQESIATSPLAARIDRGTIRVVTIARFPYRIYYGTRGNDVLIVAIPSPRLLA
jgi:plasmid stabilization system protein ParE